MRLIDAVNKINTKNNLNLDAGAITAMVSRVRITGFTDNVTNKDIETIEKLVIKNVGASMQPTKVTASIEGPLVETRVIAAGMSCPNCKGSMTQVKLLNNRTSAYCDKDRITLPYAT